MGGSASHEREAAPPQGTKWRYEPVNGAAIGIRTFPQVDAELVAGAALEPGETFWVRQELEGEDGVLFLELADRRGWVFDRKPGVGVMCVRHLGLRELVDQALQRAEVRVGRIAVRGRYHRPPRRVEDDYVVKRQVLGSGCHGDVMLGVSRQTGAKVAVKRLQLLGVTDKEVRALVNEVEILLSMDHPHVARLLDVYEAEDRITLVMECLEGGELFDRVMDAGCYAEQDAAAAARQMLLAVRYLHSMGVAHRDLKLENFLYEQRDSAFLKLIDFGLGRFYKPGEDMTECMGTVAYLAPEVLTKRYTSQVDLWSLGVIVYILLAGQMPFRNSSDRQTLRDIRSSSYSLDFGHWASVSEAARNFVSSLLCLQPDVRLTAEQALGHCWLAQQLGGADASVPARGAARAAGVAEALAAFAQASDLRRACLRLAAWSLLQSDRSRVQQAFLELDCTGAGVIHRKDLRHVLEQAALPAEVCLLVCRALAESDGEAAGADIRYSDFLAAVMASQAITPTAAVLRDTFRRFDSPWRGRAPRDSLEKVLCRGKGADAADMLDELPWSAKCCIEVANFVACCAVPRPLRSATGVPAPHRTEELAVSCRRDFRSQGGGLYADRWRMLLLLPFLFTITLAATSNPILVQ